MNSKKEQKPTYKDPVCGMVISQLTAPATYEYRGKIYYFCAEVCRNRFESNPDKYKEMAKINLSKSNLKTLITLLHKQWVIHTGSQKGSFQGIRL